MTTKGEKLYEGKAKIIFSTNNPDQVIMYFKDDATAFNAEKKGTIGNKGIFNAGIATKTFQLLEQAGVETHLIEQINEREILAHKCDMIPLEVVMRNVVAGSMAKRFGKPEGEKLPVPILEFYYKDDALGDPFINSEHIHAFGYIDRKDLPTIESGARKVNEVLVKYFETIGIRLVDFKIEFGYAKINGKRTVVLADEISPDSCRLWDLQTNEKLDKDRFRRDLGKIEEAYQKVFDLMQGTDVKSASESK